MANMSVVDKIRHYQRSLDKCTDHGTRTLHCIEKLYRLPVTVQHLQETGVGRTVNALRKYDGSIGDAAKALVAKWKTMVVDEDSSDGEDEDEACIPDAPEGYSDSNSPKPDKSSREEASRNSSKQKSNDSREKSRDKHESRDTSKNSSSTSESTKVRENETKTSRETSDDGQQKYSKNGIDKKSSRSEDKSEKRSKSSRESKNDSKHSVRETSSHRRSSSSGKDGRNKLEDCKKDSSRVSSSSGGSNHSATSKSKWSSNDPQRKRKLESSSSERETSKRRKSLGSSQDDDDDDGDDEDNDDEDEDDDLPTQISSRDSDVENEKILPDTSIESESEDETLKTKIKRETPDSPIFYERGSPQSRNSTKTEKSSKSKNRDNTDKSTSDKSRRDSEKRSKSERATSEHRKNEKRKDDARSPSRESSSSKSKSHGESSSSSRHRSSSKHKDESRERSKSKRENKSDSDSKESKEKFKEPKDKKIKKKKKINGDGGIDCNSGASFAEALGMCTDRPSSRKKNAVSPSSPLIKTIKTEPGTSSSSSSSGSKTAVKIKTEPPTSSEPQPLSLLAPNVKLEPLNVDLASTLPEISPNYKPLPAQYATPVHRKQDEDKSLSDAIYSKGQRTKVYSGMKSGYTSVPSLCEVCIRILIKHMDALGFTGGIPYDILKPVLERAMPDQLFTLENYNPYLIEDTDSLWQFHCNREFREKRREEMESWRDMYMRCRDEREIKLKALTANIKEAIDKSVPVRSTKLAYVDNVVKPPRNVLRNQARYGTAKSSTPTSDLKKKLILSGGSNSATNISVPAPPMSRMKSSSSSSLKKNKAPLMAKALQLIKGRYKR